MIKEEYIMASQDNVDALINEVRILKSCDHKNIIKLIDNGSNGTLILSTGREIKHLVYIVMEYLSS